jgi:hypothetical protein
MTDFSPKFQKIQKNPNWVEITEYHVLWLIYTQKGQQMTKLDFWNFFGIMQWSESLHYNMVYLKVKII